MRRNFTCFLLALVFLIFIDAASAQTTEDPIKLTGLVSNVEVNFDARSIPYINAANDADLYYVQGFVTARDRLWQMDLLRRVARGETAEIFGKATIEEDKKWRRYGFARIADESVKHLQPEIKKALEDYARGVNAYIATLNKDTLPVEFRILRYSPREWTTSDSIVIGKILAEALSNTYQLDLIRESMKGIDPAKLADLTNPVTAYDVILYGSDKKSASAANQVDQNYLKSSDDNAELAAIAKNEIELRERSLSRIGMYAEDLAASNNWVVSGKLTADGKPILANDPHLLASAPGIWYLVHLSSPYMRVAGVTFPGVPGVVLGHNAEIAWGATNVGPDVQDLYVETFNDKGEYQTQSGWKPVTEREEVIKFRANPLDPTLSSETLKVRETSNGPVIIERDKISYSLKWTAFDPKNSDFSAFFYLNRAKDWNSFKKALSDYGGSMQNFVYADVKGNIGWQTAGKVPIRRKGDGSLPYDGSKNDGDWIGSIPFNELPNLYNPASGFIMTANQRIVGTDYKYPQLVREYAAPWRARRLYDLISNDKKATVNSTLAHQHDVYNIPLSMFAKEMISLNVVPANTVNIIKNWDGKMVSDSQAAIYVNEVRVCSANKIADANKPVPAYLIRERVLFWALAERSSRWLPSSFDDYGALLKACVTETESSLTKRFGEDRSNWVWGKVMTARFPHPLAVAPLIGAQFATPNQPIAGSGQTPNVASAVSMRHIATPGNWDFTSLVIPLGQSGDPKSPFYKDQFNNWNNTTPAIFPFSADAVKKATVKNLSFVKD